jgi:hypothetical protein
MAALYPIRLAPPPLSAKTVSQRNQMPSSKSLAGGSAYIDRPLVLKGQNVLNFLLSGRADVRLGVGPILSWFRPKTLAPTSGLSQPIQSTPDERVNRKLTHYL